MSSRRPVRTPPVRDGQQQVDDWVCPAPGLALLRALIASTEAADI
ncbi:hypothetical protein [Streptosporangium sp. KLBMP 9127]